MPTDLNALLQPMPEYIRHLRLGTNDAEGLGLRKGDLLIIDTSLEPRFGDVVVASIRGHWRPRRLVRMSGQIILTAKTFTTPDCHFQVWAELDLLGVVTHSVHSHRVGRSAQQARKTSARPPIALARNTLNERLLSKRII